MSKLKQQLKNLEEVRSFPPFKGGFVVEVNFNNEVVLVSGEKEDYNSFRLSKTDSDNILNIITIALREQIKDEE